AVLGGTQSLHTNSMDEVLALPSEKAAKIALRTQQIIAYETGVINTIDPLAGSYFIEKLTDEMEEEAFRYFEEIEKFGGVIPAIDAGFFQREIADAAYEYQKKIEKEKKIIVGVNRFKEQEELEIELLKIDPEVEKEQIRRLARLKSERNNDLVKKDLNKLKEAARGTKNLVPIVLQAARDYVTEGEIISALKEVFGEYKETPIF
ncbi:unnamed protein product, partial [marine sediment metagenome]